MSETLYQFCERVVVAGHIRNHAALNRDNFSECRDGFCRDWHETHSNTRAAHPAVEVLDALEASLMSRIEELSKPWGYSTGCTKVGIQEAVNNLRELRKAKGV